MEYTGIVTKGAARARELGFPTINVPFQDSTISGVYVGCVRIERREYQAAIYADQRRGILEAHLFGFDEDLYGETVGIRMIEKLRDDVHFETEDALTAAIAADIANARAYFKL